MRVRVSLDIRKPVKRKMRSRKQGRMELAKLQVRKTSIIMYFCGVIGYADTFYVKRYDNYKKGMEMPYGTWLRVSPRPVDTTY